MPLERGVSGVYTVITDCWHGYDKLEADGWHHVTVSHQYDCTTLSVCTECRPVAKGGIRAVCYVTVH